MADLPFLMTEAELAQHWRVTPGALRNVRYRGEGLPYIHTKTGVRGGVRYRLDDVLAYDKASLKGFTYEGFAGVLARCKSLDGKQRHEVMEAVRLWLRPPK